MQTPDLACTHTSLETWHAHTPLLRHGMQTRLFVKYTHPSRHLLIHTSFWTVGSRHILLDSMSVLDSWRRAHKGTHTHLYTHTHARTDTGTKTDTDTDADTLDTDSTERDRERQRETEREAGRRERGLSLGRREMEQ